MIHLRCSEAWEANGKALRIHGGMPVRIALVHDWLTGMRGGEKCLEALCHHWPQADIYTLFKRPNSLSETINRHPVYTSFYKSYRYVGFVIAVVRALT